MCPQANVSKTLLTEAGKFLCPKQQGEETVSDISKHVVSGASGFSYESTVCGYLLAKLDRNDTVIGTNNYWKFLSHVYLFNHNIADNVYLLCGDLYLEVLSKRLEQERQLLPTRYDIPWKRVTLYMRDFIEGLTLSDPTHDYTFFIDTNPSFSIYTEIALSAAELLIVPSTSDDFSLSAIKAVIQLVYGCETDDSQRMKILNEYQFGELAVKHKINLPKLHLFLNNRTTVYRTRTAAAYAAIGFEIGQILKQVYDRNSYIFANPNVKVETYMTTEQIRKRYIFDVHDVHTKGILSLHFGCPISQLEAGDYQMYGQTIKLHPIDLQDRLKKYNENITLILQML